MFISALIAVPFTEKPTLETGVTWILVKPLGEHHDRS